MDTEPTPEKPIFGSDESIPVEHEAGRGVTRSGTRPLKVPGAVLSPESRRELLAELADIRRAERDGLIGADNYYLGISEQP